MHKVESDDPFVPAEITTPADTATPTLPAQTTTIVASTTGNAILWSKKEARRLLALTVVLLSPPQPPPLLQEMARVTLRMVCVGGCMTLASLSSGPCTAMVSVLISQHLYLLSCQGADIFSMV